MYLKPNQGYYDSNGQQHARRGDFLILMSDETKPFGPDNFRAIVRKVALSQFGHWMMGKARIHGHTITLSGSYGSDGLTKSVPSKVFKYGVPVPKELYDLWCNGGGHNTAGSEASSMRKWAIETFLTKKE